MNQDFGSKVNFIWSVADEVLRDDFKRGKYPDVILPFTVLRRGGLVPKLYAKKGGC
ncbi:MAG: type I restriction-modification system subunit M N-terminal domain-containing protein [Planctomycetota bacterium]